MVSFYVFSLLGVDINIIPYCLNKYLETFLLLLCVE